jgi:5-methylcytosine-specific restriction endonuclease McrA
VRLADIFERDKWHCHLCGQPVDKSLAGHHPLMASLDHIIPVSDPGYPGHVAANLALAHLICNTSKGARARAEDWARYRLLSKGEDHGQGAEQSR